MDLLDAERERQAGVDLAVPELDAHRLGRRLDRLVPDHGHRLHRGDVEREPERLPDADGATLEVVGIGGRVAAAEVRDDIHEHRGGRDGARGNPARVDDGLERRAGLPPAVGEDVEPRLELAGRLRRRRVRGPDVGDKVARGVVHRDERPVVQVLGAQVVHPAFVRDPEGRRGGARRLRVGDDRRGLHPLLGDRLEPHVEGRGDGQATALDVRARLGVAAQLGRELAPHLPHELGRLPLARLLGGEHDLLRSGGVEVGGREPRRRSAACGPAP